MTMNDKPKRPGSKPFARDKQTKSDGAKPAKAAAVKAADETVTGDGKAERISKVMARAGVASRRDIERMILDGRVSLNGVLLDTPVVNVTLADKIEVDGVPIRGIERTRLWLYHKPAGLVTTNADPEGRPTVFDNLPEELPRVLSIGRLDINTEGLLLLTNDGGLARVLELPTTGWLRRYRVRAHGEIDQEALDKLKEGIAVDGVLYGSIDATLDRTQGSNVWITMGLREGKNREIKNVLGALGLEVNRLIRISYGPFQLGELPEGHVLEVRGRTLRDQLGPRLVDEAKANFDAPLYNAPAVADAEEADAKPARTAPVRAAKEERPRRERPEDKRERALSRLDTKRDAKHDDRREGGHKDDDRAKRQPLGPRRSANVWMAPGARPLGEKAAAKAAKNVRTAAKRGEAERPQRSGYDRPDEGPRVRVNRVDEADGEWIRSSEEAPRKARGDNDDFDRKRSERPRGDRPFGDRPPRGDRPFGDKPRGDRPYGDKPRGDRPFSDRPRGERGSRPEGGDRPRAKSFQGEARSERSFGDRPARSERPYGDKPRGDRPFGDKPRGDRRPRAEGDERPRGRSFGGEQRSERPRGDRPQGDHPPRERPFADRAPRGDRPFGDRPQGERSFGDRPPGKPFGKKPGGGKSFGGKPGGKPGGPRGFGGKPGGAGRPSGGPRGGSGRGGPGRGGPKGGRG
ncbi:pseudouridine synthase [Rhizobium sp. P40RR-XXII]|uniref:pseudouridine synthase n=1 Tax=Rhizobium sp. P28RR-XV TaxID=2726737 RepID=UPI0014573504|nr:MULTISPECIES: pseudouridine synthase [unclassified Rhizobium]NLR87031.1 pseudouridine synthase [Rhizobium sp. P28RR-XV]NLS17948.1 pseudouridine synthase [Rhizobium sp. P40RR-XXII]